MPGGFLPRSLLLSTASIPTNKQQKTIDLGKPYFRNIQGPDHVNAKAQLQGQRDERRARYHIA